MRDDEFNKSWELVNFSEVKPIKKKTYINAIKRSLHGRNRLLFIVGINSGLRVSDLLKLKVGDLRGDYVQIREGKTGKTKKFALNDAIKKAVKELVPADASDDDFAFPSRKGGGKKALSRQQAYNILNEAVERAGLSDKIGAIGTHSMRKAWAYAAYQNGTPMPLLMKALNHASQRETLRYIGVEQEQIDEVHAQVNL
ncbi:site-specific integrase [Salicibibacter kimchii]|uniref:site-specific integrase n=1 Tax=Salicibibacter kimchii TaxID=2099786 RepID=UPI001D03AB84|nr:site-specific integrase [Salicibibacter kimchii]